MSGARVACLVDIIYWQVKNVVAQFIGLPSLSLRGARSLAYASEQASQSRGGGNEIATPRLVGARNDKKRRAGFYQVTTKSGCLRR